MITREDLYKLVWSKPMLRVAEQFKVSSSYMARVCTALNVPRPAQGYWAKVAVGRTPTQDPLPVARPGDLLSWTRDGELPRQPRVKYDAKPPRTKPIGGPSETEHALVRGAKEHFEAGRPVEDGAYLKPYKRLLLDVVTSKDCLDKCFKFANTLFKAAESAGFRVMIAANHDRFRRAVVDERESPSKRRDYNGYGMWSPHRPTVVYVGNVPIGLTIVEMSEDVLMRYVGSGKYIREEDYSPPARMRHQEDRTWTTTKVIPSGRMKLTAYCPIEKVSWIQEWKETPKLPLDRAVPSIMREIQDAAAELILKLEEADRQAEIAHQKWLIEQERYRRQEDARRVELSVKESRDELAQIIQRWSQVVSVEQFFAGVESRASGLGADKQSEVLTRLDQARSFLGTQDPLEFFLSWKTPNERYQPRYGDRDEPSE